MTTAPTSPDETSLTHPCLRVNQPPRRASSAPVQRPSGGTGASDGRSRCRPTRTAPTTASPIAYWGFVTAARAATATAGSLQPSINRRTAPSSRSAPTASTWPQTAESYQVTGMKRKTAAAMRPARSPHQRRAAR